MNRKKQNKLTKDELEDCQTFKRIRINYNMNQKKWAEQTGISYSLIKKIETYSMKCSSKTKQKVHNFITQHPNNPDGSNLSLSGLEAHILYDIFQSHIEEASKKDDALHPIEQMHKEDTAVYSIKCINALQSLLSNIELCETVEAKKNYLRFLSQLLVILEYATTDTMVHINDNEDIFTDENGLKPIFTSKQIKQYGKGFQYNLTNFGL